jgi:hypothetical protein
MIMLTQLSLIQQILHDVDITSQSNGKNTPADSILYVDSAGPDCIERWNYRSIIGKLNYLTNNTWPDISMAMHQCARFFSNPKAIHDLAVKCIACYLPATQEKGHMQSSGTAFYQELVMLFYFAIAPLYSAVSYRMRSHFLQQKVSILLSLQLSEIYFPYAGFFRTSTTTVSFLYFLHNLMLIQSLAHFHHLKYLKITTLASP